MAQRQAPLWRNLPPRLPGTVAIRAFFTVLFFAEGGLLDFFEGPSDRLGLSRRTLKPVRSVHETILAYRRTIA